MIEVLGEGITKANVLHPSLHTLSDGEHQMDRALYVLILMLSTILQGDRLLLKKWTI